MQTTTTPWIPEENPSLDGPDYVALVIEWDDSDYQVTKVTKAPSRTPKALLQVGGVVVAGALGALALVAWGIHRLRS
ncbi:MAG: hypothetical protein H0T46_02540 [Deltaproteobacteria bacterium]|nr:hypothetical protein [Deltaproteobacteria bacterium]